MRDDDARAAMGEPRRVEQLARLGDLLTLSGVSGR